MLYDNGMCHWHQIRLRHILDHCGKEEFQRRTDNPKHQGKDGLAREVYGMIQRLGLLARKLSCNRCGIKLGKRLPSKEATIRTLMQEQMVGWLLHCWV